MRRVECGGMLVANWIPDGGDKPTQVHLVVGAGPEAWAIALKSRRVARELIEALVDHVDEVWPEGRS